MMREWLLVFHVLGQILWVGSIVSVGLGAALGVKDREALRKVMRFVSTPGLLLSFATGLWVLLPNFGDVYAKQGWMHAKLTFVLALAALHGVLMGRLKKQASPALERGLAIAALAIAFGSLVLVAVRPF